MPDKGSGDKGCGWYRPGQGEMQRTVRPTCGAAPRIGVAAVEFKDSKALNAEPAVSWVASESLKSRFKCVSGSIILIFIKEIEIFTFLCSQIFK
jgi:hypothetical protein